MLSVQILYPKSDDTTFDMDYYCKSHMPMLAKALGDACVHWGAATPAGKDWAGIGWAMVTSKEAFDAAMAEHGAAIMGDIPNYTNSAPQMIVSEIAHLWPEEN
ncbi:MAG: EthD family reductase [Actinomycetota bacterium]